MSKNYKTIKFKNPSSKQHIVRLKPGQSMEIFLDEKKFPDPKVIVDSNLTSVELCKKQDHYKKFEIYQKSFLRKWLDYSAVCLGSVKVNSSIGCSKIIMIAESSNNLKSNVLTVLNPNNSLVRLTPGDILEVILFNEKNKLENQEWEWEFSGMVDCDVELLGNRSFVFDSEEKQSPPCPDFPYAALSRIKEKCMQHHFWFRFDKRLMSLLDVKEPTPQHMGELVFFDTSTNVKHHTSLHMVLQKKYKTRVLNSLLLPKLDFEQPDAEDDFLILNTLNNVVIKKINPAYIFEGCRVKSILPTSNFDVLSSSCGSYDEECF